MTPSTPARRRATPNGGQRLQSYQSYLQTEYFNNIKPGGNQGGWIDGGGDAALRRAVLGHAVCQGAGNHAVQLAANLRLGLRGAGGGSDTERQLRTPISWRPFRSLTAQLTLPTWWPAPPAIRRKLLDRFLGKLGKPVGVATYKPCNSVGEAYLPDYLGMVGVPVDLVPEFPTNAPTVLLTAASSYDPDLVAKTEGVCAERRPGHCHERAD